MRMAPGWIGCFALSVLTTLASPVAATEAVTAKTLQAEVAALQEALAGLERRVRELETGGAPCGELDTVRALLAEAERRLDGLNEAVAVAPEQPTAPEVVAEAEPAPAPKPSLVEAVDQAVDFYGGLRVRPAVSFDGDAEVSNKVSRIGWAGSAPLGKGFEVIGRLELGVNVVDQNPQLVIGGDPGYAYGEGSQAVTTRLGVVGIDSPYGALTWGKQWSVYSDVAGWTDSFQTWGGDALGVYAAGTDGGIAGTGRAEKAIQYRHRLGPVHLGLQAQNRSRTENTPRFGATWGASLVVDLSRSLALGFAYNRVKDGVSGPEPNEPRAGDTAAVLGLRYQRGPLYLAAGAADLDSHEVDEQGRPFDGTGFELFSQVDVTPRWFVYAGGNDLEPDGPEVGDYHIQYGVAGIGYRVRGAMAPGPPPASGGVEVGAEVLFNGSTSSDGSRLAESAFSLFLNFGW